MQDKRGLSQVITTVIIIALIIAVIAGIWAVLNPFIREQAQKIEFNSIDLELVSAVIDYGTGIATLKVGRNTGEGNLSGINVIVEDDLNSDVFYIETPNFKELTFRTIFVNLTKSNIIVIGKIRRISIAPVYFRGQGTDPVTGGILDFTTKFNGVNETEDEEEPEPDTCVQASDCGIDYWIEGTQTCSQDGTSIKQSKKIYSCLSGFCFDEIEQQTKETCLVDQTCFNAVCVDETSTCTPETVEQDCGINAWVGFPQCSQTSEGTIIQDYREMSCVEGYCQETVTTKEKEQCQPEEICSEGECFIPLECVSNSDCNLGEVCEAGECVTETAMVTGNIASSWPPGLNEYFESSDLPKTGNINYVGTTVIFPGSAQTTCLSILKYVYPEDIQDNAYVQLNSKETNISSGDSFEIWETNYACTL